MSAFQIQFGGERITTPGDEPDVLVAMNPAALKVNLRDLRRGGLLLVNTGAFGKGNLKKAGYEVNPLEDGSTDPYRTLQLDISKMTLASVEELLKPDGRRESQRRARMLRIGLSESGESSNSFLVVEPVERVRGLENTPVIRPVPDSLGGGELAAEKEGAQKIPGCRSSHASLS